MLRTAALTGLALVAFAANSVLCRLALAGEHVDAATFSSVRVASGALVLGLLAAGARRAPAWRSGDWTSALALFVYAVPFSFAYVGLDAGTGALLLFGAVQATMLLSAVRAGERPRALEWTGLVLALGGLVYLVLPGLEAPPPGAAALMVGAGVGWGWYSLRGRHSRAPLSTTAGNFLRCLPLVLGVSLATLARAHADPRGVLLAIASGALASGVGYALWYAALRGLSATRAATVQLSVPVLAAAGGMLFLGESASVRLVLSAVLILGGVGLALLGRPRAA